MLASGERLLAYVWKMKVKVKVKSRWGQEGRQSEVLGKINSRPAREEHGLSNESRSNKDAMTLLSLVTDLSRIADRKKGKDTLLWAAKPFSPRRASNCFT